MGGRRVEWQGKTRRLVRDDFDRLGWQIHSEDLDNWERYECSWSDDLHHVATALGTPEEIGVWRTIEAHRFAVALRSGRLPGGLYWTLGPVVERVEIEPFGQVVREVDREDGETMGQAMREALLVLREVVRG